MAAALSGTMRCGIKKAVEHATNRLQVRFIWPFLSLYLGRRVMLNYSYKEIYINLRWLRFFINILPMISEPT